MSAASTLGDLVRIAASIAEATATRRSREAAPRLAVSAVLIATAIACGLGAAGCAVTSLWICLIPRLGAAGAPLAIAGLLLFACFVALAVLQNGSRSRSRTPSAPLPNLIDPAAMLLAEARGVIKEHKVPLLISALLAGLIAGEDRK